MILQFSGQGNVDKACHNIGRRRQKAPIAKAGHQQALPDNQKTDGRNEIKAARL